MEDQECVRFLQWALPRLRMRWAGFRRVRRQVCRRIDRRLRELQLPDITAYQDHLERHDDEWRVLDSLCRVTISRFYRDRGLFDQLASMVLPTLARQTTEPGIGCWCAGCASGEEAYTLEILWKLRLAASHPELSLDVLGTDTDAFLLERAKVGLFPWSSLKELPIEWLALAFDHEGSQFRLRKRYRENVRFQRSDIRQEAPDQTFDLICCRNLAFTYFEEAQQHEVLGRIGRHLHPGGALFIGVHEELPAGAEGFVPWRGCRAVFRRQD